ncbi:baseplate multidomain protein megatron [Pseudoprimorskyibacter insulae]|uniref:Host specificity protein n=1 Tax=Pseudoprimorskyibacter insulae TaxID=1695997 RepID=A0A2R8AY88_9RHOB|nr:glycoside hydrolase TIM-barrel-like domain-containing protein [Pseudoprimorskyibacter insulae]SPF80824.1 hypothetical protein PRI8871_02636 [Pseudoprimorskyibacter insulae]
MATILLSAAGAAIGGAVGGTVLGLSAAAIGQFAGATLGRALDQRIMGRGSDAVEAGRLDRLRVSGAGEGKAVPRLFGRVRVGGQVIWASNFEEHVTVSGGGGKGAPRGPEVHSYSYSVSLALALCEGEIAGVRRVWADGAEVAMRDLNIRIYKGDHTQLPDPKMEAIEGPGMVPAYRGTAYVVIEDLSLAKFGNRVPQFSFEVVRNFRNDDDLPRAVRGVAMLPGSGEYALATDPVQFDRGAGDTALANVHSPSGLADFVTSLEALDDELPNCGSVSLVVSWFGDDLRCGSCQIQPKVEQAEEDAATMPWSVCGQTRSTAALVPTGDKGPVYGGTPADASVIQAIARMRDRGKSVMMYPFILMDQMDGNSLPDPYSGDVGQPVLPWRGRITLSKAPGQNGSPDQSASADAEVAQFYGTASASDFSVVDGQVSYSGPADWGFRRFILHQAALCVAAGGVDAFCIGSEMRGVTQIRGANGFPAVAALLDLAAEVRSLLGPSTKIGYAADWSEYFGYHPQDGSGDVLFHLDPLWADPNIDFMGIDNYMPLSDWRDGDDHADAAAGAVYDLDYLRANIAGGEGHDWYYPSPEARAAQRRVPIEDLAHGEDWVFRYKDLRNWWSQPHHDRIAGVRQGQPTDWVPQSKPFWFTELGCAAVDKATNQPNIFVDDTSSEGGLPIYSNGLRDDFIQWQYLRAMHAHWSEEGNNPVSDVFGGAMVDMSKAFVWAWDARPYPWFPSSGAWTDGDNYRRGHWISGRMGARSLASVVREICEASGLTSIDVSGLYGVVRGYVLPDMADARAALQPLMMTYGFEAIERDGTLVFRMRPGQAPTVLALADLAVDSEIKGDLELRRAGDVDLSGRVRIGYVEADGDHAVATQEAVLPDEGTHAVSAREVPLTLTRAEARQTAERWLSEARVARDTLRFALPASRMDLGAGDLVRLPHEGEQVLARVDRVELSDHLQVEAVRVETGLYTPADFPDDAASVAPVSPAGPVFPVLMGLPLMSEGDDPVAPHLAVTARPWPGRVAAYSASEDGGYTLSSTVTAQSTIGVTQSEMLRAPMGRIDRGSVLEVKLTSGQLESVTDTAFLSGGNLFAIGSGSAEGWEVFQARDAELIAPRTWRLSHFLRGQLGTDADMPDVWPAGSIVVALNGVPRQLPEGDVLRGVERHFRIGPAALSYDDPVYRHRSEVFSGVGLRPYRPVHLRAMRDNGGEQLRWMRRTRIEGDGWDGLEVPLGEQDERYLIRVTRGGVLLRETIVGAPEWLYSAADISQDGPGIVLVEVAQISATVGAGPVAQMTLTI